MGGKEQMKNIGFIGAFDKLDLLLYISKILTMLGKKVVIVDTTLEQKSKYIVPVISPTKSYITRFENIDIAVGFETYQEIERYIGQTENKKMSYDYALVNIDTIEGFERFHDQETIKDFFVTSFDMYSIRKGLEAISKIQQPIELSKILFSSKLTQEDVYYLEYLALGYKIKWNEEIINFPYETNDLEVMMENEKANKVGMKNLTPAYRENLEYLITNIMPDIDLANLRRVMKNIEKEG